MKQSKAVVLLSGGLDSSTCLAIAQTQGYECHALSFRYGQRSFSELMAAQRICEQRGVQHIVMDLHLEKMGGSALTDHSIPVPVNEDSSMDIPVTYVPARNTIFLSFGLGWCEVLNAPHLFIGANIVDYSGYPDCRPEFLSAFEKVANLGTKMGVENHFFRIHAPILYMSKAEIIKEGIRLNVDYQNTVSCYKATKEGAACGKCTSCRQRAEGFAEAGVPDPTRYVSD